MAYLQVALRVPITDRNGFLGAQTASAVRAFSPRMACPRMRGWPARCGQLSVLDVDHEATRLAQREDPERRLAVDRQPEGHHALEVASEGDAAQ